MMINKPPSLPEMPPGSSWTEEQWEAIHSQGRDILVSAGAGSGKTRVLVERIIQLITDQHNPLEVDGLLVVTFTNAAAAEMRQRIARALEDAIKEDPGSYHLRRQLFLLNKAFITTLHSFCSSVLKRYYYHTDIDPSFRIMEETEAELLRYEVLESVLEEKYENSHEDSTFYRLVEVYSTDRGDTPLQNLILKLYRFSLSHPWPDKWLEEMVGAFNLNSPEELLETAWMETLLMECRQQLEGLTQQLQEGIRICKEPGGPDPYLQNLESELEMLEKLLASSRVSWQELQKELKACSFVKLKACRGNDYDQNLKDRAKGMRDRVKKSLENLEQDLFQQPLEKHLEIIRCMAPEMKELANLVLSFKEAYNLAKAQRRVVDFSDLEHQTLKILSCPDSGGEELTPSEAAREYRGRFVQVLVDEYQDINLVQEYILKLVSRRERGRENLYMVGDVKQSIYGFRLAEPGLFLQKAKDFTRGRGRGKCIDLYRNFRSRREILDGVNYLFRQIMDEKVGDIAYEGKAELIYGNSYPPEIKEKESEREREKEGQQKVEREERGGDKGSPLEVLLISRADFREAEKEKEKGKGKGKGDASGGAKGVQRSYRAAGEDAAEGEGEGEIQEGLQEALNEEEWENASLEGRLIASKIKEMVGDGPLQPEQIWDKEEKRMRPITYRDIVILLRSAPNWISPILEELKSQGIPAYAELGTGYFEAVEVEVMLSLLRVIDNPYQDIPLAAVLRSPLVGLSAEELALIRTENQGRTFYDAVKEYNDRGNPELMDKLQDILGKIQDWQDLARQGALADLIWQIYRDTGFYELAGGMAGGQQRQANLRVLYHRARQYEATSFRGLFRFLWFIEKLKEGGGDMGTARALGEQENVVRLGTIHKSKGLEYPIVFLAGLGKQFNLKDLKGDFLLHNKMGLGPRFVDAKNRVVYPTLPFMALKKRLHREVIAEEMRVMYVALTRAEQKLLLVSTVKDVHKELEKWQEFQQGSMCSGEALLSGYQRARAKSYLDWIGPALLRHPRATCLREMLNNNKNISCFPQGEPSAWKFTLLTQEEVIRDKQQVEGDGIKEEEKNIWENLKAMNPIPVEEKEKEKEEINRCLAWQYPYHLSTIHLAKVSVSELKNKHGEAFEQEYTPLHPVHRAPEPQLFQRPRFIEGEKLSKAEKGTAYHTALQHFDLRLTPGEDTVKKQLDSMLERGLITPEEREAVKEKDIKNFFAGPLGQRMRRGLQVFREVPFTLTLPPEMVYPSWSGTEQEKAGQNVPLDNEAILVQGVIDCVLKEKEGLVLIDYKTDNTQGLDLEDLKNRYFYQLQLYSQALENIWKEKVKEKYLYFFHGDLVIPVD